MTPTATTPSSTAFAATISRMLPGKLGAIFQISDRKTRRAGASDPLLERAVSPPRSKNARNDFSVAALCERRMRLPGGHRSPLQIAAGNHGESHYRNDLSLLILLRTLEAASPRMTTNDTKFTKNETKIYLASFVFNYSSQFAETAALACRRHVRPAFSPTQRLRVKIVLLFRPAPSSN